MNFFSCLVSRSRETVFHVVPFRKCTYACCRMFFVGNAYVSSLSLTLHKYWFLWTEFSMYKWRISTLSRASTLWTGFCELSGGVVTLWTGKWKPHRALSRIHLNCATGSTAAYNTIRVFERWSTFNPASAVRDAPAHVPLALPSPLLPTGSVTPYFLRSSDPSGKSCHGRPWLQFSKQPKLASVSAVSAVVDVANDTTNVSTVAATAA